MDAAIGSTALSALADLVPLATVVADGRWGDGDGDWWIARLAFLAFWVVAVVAILTWLVVGRGRSRGGPSGPERTRAILAERYARGEIDADEYQERTNRLS